LVKVVNKICEEYKVQVRNARRDSNEMIKELKKSSEISEDDAFKSQEKIQKKTDEFIKLVDDCYKEKEKEILEF
jgi:ribosome recycling factor